MTSTSHKIKGIVLLFSFQESRFGESHRKGLEKIVNLIPLDNFWSYVTIIFTKTFWDESDELNEIKEQRLKDFKSIFDTLISAFYKVKSIKKIPFSKINTVFVNLKEKKTKKKDLNNIISVFKEKSKLEPLFHQVKIEEVLDKVLLLNKNNNNIGDLFEVKYKVYNYYNQNGEIIKKIAKPIEKKFIKQLVKTEYDGKFQETCDNVTITSGIISIFSVIGGLALLTICPQATNALMVVGFSSGSITEGSYILQK